MFYIKKLIICLVALSLSGDMIETTPVGGSIVMEDSVMRVDSQAPTNPITQVQIFDESKKVLKFESNGCYESVCAYEVNLAAGTYYAKATTENGENFGNLVTIE